MKRMSLVHATLAALLVFPTAALADPLDQMFPHGQANDFGWTSASAAGHPAATPPVGVAAVQSNTALQDEFHTGQNDAFGAASGGSAPSSRIEYFAAGGYTRVVSSVPSVGAAPARGGVPADPALPLYAPGVGYSPTTPDIYHLRPFNFTSQTGG